MIFKETHYSVRQKDAGGLFRRRISFRSILSCQNGLNRYMGQNICLGPQIQFLSFFPYRAIIGSQHEVWGGVGLTEYWNL